MKKILLLLLFPLGLAAQQNCGVVCHNGRLLTGVNENAVAAFERQGAVFITFDCDYVETGNECDVLSLPKIDFKTPIEKGLEYVVYDITGRVLQKGLINDSFVENLPYKNILLVKIEGYRVGKFYK